MIKVISAIWEYFKNMNTGTNGKLSINRNMAWGIATVCVFVQVYSLQVMPKEIQTEIQLFKDTCEFYVVTDISFVLLALGITSVEKITELVKKLKGGIGNGSTETQPDNSNTPPPDAETLTEPEKEQP